MEQKRCESMLGVSSEYEEDSGEAPPIRNSTRRNQKYIKVTVDRGGFDRKKSPPRRLTEVAKVDRGSKLPKGERILWGGSQKLRSELKAHIRKKPQKRKRIDMGGRREEPQII